MESVNVSPVYHGKYYPPFSKNLTDLQPTSTGTRIKKVLMMLSLGLVAGFIVGAICTGISGDKDARWPTYSGIGIASLIFIFGTISALKSQQAPCPYCGQDVGKSASTNINRNDANIRVECPHCFEWLISNGGQLRAFRNEDITEQKDFRVPVFVNGVWPPECIVCGAPTARYFEATQQKVQVAKLLLGKIAVTAGAVRNIPYCMEHSDAVSVDVFVNELHLVFKDYDARRRYLYANTNRTIVKTK